MTRRQWLSLGMTLCWLLGAHHAWAQPPVLIAHFRDRPPDMVSYCDERFNGPLRAVIDEAVARVGAQVEWRKAPLSQSLKDLTTGAVDIVPFIFFKTPEREKTARFSEIMGKRTRQVLFLSSPEKAGNFKKTEDLVGRKVGVIKGVVYFEGFDDLKLQTTAYGNEAALARAFSRGEVEVVPVIDKEALQRALLTIGYTKFAYASLVKDQQLDQYILFPKVGKNGPLFDKLDRVIVQMRKDGEVAEIYESFGADAPK